MLPSVLFHWLVEPLGDGGVQLPPPPPPPLVTVNDVCWLTLCVPLVQVNVKMTVVGEAGAVRFCVPLTDSVPKLAQLVPVPPEGEQLVVLLELQEMENAPLTRTELGLTPKELMTGDVFGAVHSLRFPVEDLKMTFPVAASMLTALVVEDAVSGIAGTLSSDRFWAITGVVARTIASTAANAAVSVMPDETSRLSTCSFLVIWSTSVVCQSFA